MFTNTYIYENISKYECRTPISLVISSSPIHPFFLFFQFYPLSLFSCTLSHSLVLSLTPFRFLSDGFNHAAFGHYTVSRYSSPCGMGLCRSIKLSLVYWRLAKRMQYSCRELAVAQAPPSFSYLIILYTIINKRVL